MQFRRYYELSRQMTLIDPHLPNLTDGCDQEKSTQSVQLVNAVTVYKDQFHVCPDRSTTTDNNATTIGLGTHVS